MERSHLTSRAKSRGKLHLIVNYSFKRRKRKESVLFYNDDKIKEIIKEILWRTIKDENDINDIKNRFIMNKINHKSIMNMIKENKLDFNEMASRSPCLLWSLFHSFPDQKIENVLEQFVKDSLKELRIKAQAILKERES